MFWLFVYLIPSILLLLFRLLLYFANLSCHSHFMSSLKYGWVIISLILTMLDQPHSIKYPDHLHTQMIQAYSLFSFFIWTTNSTQVFSSFWSLPATLASILEFELFTCIQLTFTQLSNQIIHNIKIFKYSLSNVQRT